MNDMAINNVLGKGHALLLCATLLRGNTISSGLSTGLLAIFFFFFFKGSLRKASFPLACYAIFPAGMRGFPPSISPFFVIIIIGMCLLRLKGGGNMNDIAINSNIIWGKIWGIFIVRSSWKHWIHAAFNDIVYIQITDNN